MFQNVAIMMVQYTAIVCLASMLALVAGVYFAWPRLRRQATRLVAMFFVFFATSLWLYFKAPTLDDRLNAIQQGTNHPLIEQPYRNGPREIPI